MKTCDSQNLSKVIRGSIEKFNYSDNQKKEELNRALQKCVTFYRESQINRSTKNLKIL